METVVVYHVPSMANPDDRPVAPRYYPAYLDLRDRRCVVVGAGIVAERKVEQLHAAGAHVTVVAPEATPRIAALADAGRIRLERRPYARGDLAGALLAFAAVDDDAVSRTVRDEATAGGVLLNVADAPDLCDFIAPAVVERGPVTLALSTGGASPALARKLREALETWPPLAWAGAAGVLSAVRRELLARGISVSPEAWQAAMDDELLSLVVAGDTGAAKSRLLDALLGQGAPR